MVATRNPGKEHGQWWFAVKDVFLIAMAAIKNPGKEQGQWGWAVKEHGQWGLVVKEVFLFPSAANRSTGKEHVQWGLSVKGILNWFEEAIRGTAWQRARALRVGSQRLIQNFIWRPSEILVKSTGNWGRQSKTMVAIRSTKNTTQAMGMGSKGIFRIFKCLYTVATDATKFNFVCLKW
jgi:hypothetical protein